MDMDRAERVEEEFRKEFKAITKTLTKIEKSISVIETKQGIGGWVFNVIAGLSIAAIGGLFGSYFSK